MVESCDGVPEGFVAGLVEVCGGEDLLGVGEGCGALEAAAEDGAFGVVVVGWGAADGVGDGVFLLGGLAVVEGVLS